MKKNIFIINSKKINKATYTALEYSYFRAFQEKSFDYDLISFNSDVSFIGYSNEEREGSLNTLSSLLN